ncbi:hypothetical protein RhiirA4_548690 [Rhizophagus irregularis]|uniref:Uncharacterized protein n=1 Tax=Rhizophagus irregularis TaxID=588596 RepID=A0A2I1H8Z8_9GLOM|nr:hypothetical protein RhiirA4_548690 [Rhizophagus irregularis]
MEIENSFNCLFLENYLVIPILVYKDDKNNKFFKSYDDERISVSIFTVALLKEYICKKKKVDNLKLWRVNVKKSVIRKNVSTEENIVEKLQGKEMEPEELFEEYFQDELNSKNFNASNIHIIATTDIIVLAGVSGGGKTSTTFAIAAEHWAIHVDCSHIISDYNNQLSSELVAVKAKCPSVNNIPLQESALRKLDIVFASRVLILIKMYVEQKIKTPKDWLLAQLYGLDKDSITLIYENLSELSAEEFSSLIRFINKCLNIRRILFIQDEAQCLCRPEFGEYFGGITHIISGIIMHMSSGLSLVTSVGKFDAPRKVHLVLKLPYLSPDDVIRVLNTVINVDGVSPETLSYLGNILKG